MHSFSKVEHHLTEIRTEIERFQSASPTAIRQPVMHRIIVKVDLRARNALSPSILGPCLPSAVMFAQPCSIDDSRHLIQRTSILSMYGM